MKESRIMTILYKGRTENDIMEMLDEQGVKYSWEFSVIGEGSTIEYTSSTIKYTMDKTYRVEFVKGICKRVLTNN